LEEATLNLSRAESVRAQGLIAQAELDRAKAQVDTLEAERSAADQRVAEAEAALSWTIVKAPIDGRIVERFAEPGDVVSPGQAIVSLYNPNTLRVAAWVRESVAVTLGPGQVLPLRIPSLGLAFDATIEEVVPAANPGSRSFLVRLVLPAQDKLMPGMYAEVDVPAPSASVIAIPARYIRSLGQLDIVWVASEEQGIERRFVRTGQRDNAMVEIIAGLSQGEALVTPP
jgi:RND family efflux transporter MFP subunit